MHQQFKRQFWSTAAVAAIVLAGGATPALAQIDEIVVSAQKREESQQDVPLAITALDDKLLDESSIDNSFELSLKTPSLVLTANGSNGQPYIRGVGTDIINPGTESSVAVNFANIYLPRPDGSITEFFDLNRFEVVKGPQGTLYGRNATGGAITLEVFTAGALMPPKAAKTLAMLPSIPARMLRTPRRRSARSP